MGHDQITPLMILIGKSGFSITVSIAVVVVRWFENLNTNAKISR